MNTYKTVLSTLAMGTFTLLPNFSTAQIAVESFDYPADSPVAGTGSAADAGFAGPWYTQMSRASITAGSLNTSAYPAFPPVGNQVMFNGDRMFRDLDRLYTGTVDETVYFSFVRKETMDPNVADNVYAAFELFNGGTNDKVNRVFALGALQFDSSTPEGVLFIEQIASRSNNVKDTVQFLGDRTDGVEFYVIKLELKANDSDTFYIYRNPQGATLGEPTATVTDLPEYPIEFDRIAFASWDHPDGIGYMTIYDEFRMGSTLADVMDVGGGEPADWYGYPIAELKWVDTGSWLGWVNITFDPWVYSNDLQKYIYVPNDSGWVWVPGS